MSEPFIGQISMFGGNFAPRGWAFCNGQLLPVAQNNALFSLLGTIYGGDGRTTFGLPDLRSRLPIDWGHGPGLSNYIIGQKSGSDSVTLNGTELPSHVHTLEATQELATSPSIAGTLIPAQATGDSAPLFYVAPRQSVAPPVRHPMATAACGKTGGNQSHTNLMPSLCITFIIALQGLFPSRN